MKQQPEQYVNQSDKIQHTRMPGLRSLLVVTLLLWAAIPINAVAVKNPEARDCVILLHGLARTADSMQKLADQLEDAGFNSVNVDYESRKSPIEVLAPDVIQKGLGFCESRHSSSVSFVTHSLGGILVRQYLANHSIENLHRVVMLAPPNRGSLVIDALRDVPGFELLNGPAGLQLGAGPESVPNTLGPVDFDLGVIAGSSTFNPLLSQLLTNPDDGKVSVESTRVEGMCGFLVVDKSHPFIMKSATVIEQVVAYLRTGRFSHADAQEIDCGVNN